MVNRADRLIGTVRLWEVAAGTAGPALLLGPTGGRAASSRPWPRFRVDAVCHRCRRSGWRSRNPAGRRCASTRVGFAKMDGLSLPAAGSRSALGLELEPGALHGSTGMVTAAGLPEIDPDLRFGT